MKFWVAERACGCVVEVCPDTGSILPVGAPNNEFIRQAVARGLKTWLSETGVSIGPCAEHRQFGPVEGNSTPPQAERGKQPEMLVEGPDMPFPPKAVRPLKIERRALPRETDTESQVTEYRRDGQLLVGVSGDKVRVYEMNFTSKSEAAAILRALADRLDGVKRRRQRKGKGNV